MKPTLIWRPEDPTINSWFGKEVQVKLIDLDHRGVATVQIFGGPCDGQEVTAHTSELVSRSEQK